MPSSSLVVIEIQIEVELEVEVGVEVGIEVGFEVGVEVEFTFTTFMGGWCGEVKTKANLSQV